MTTFQAIIDAFLSSLTHVLPISETGLNEISQNFFHAPLISGEIHLFIALMGILVWIIFFRFDILGMISALIKSIFQPLSINAAERNLDQHTFLFLLLILIPHAISQRFLAPLLSESELLNHPLVLALGFGILAFAFHFAHRWNKRIYGLNHLKLLDGAFIGILSILAAFPSFPYLGVLWIGFALFNYHYEAIYKYSMMLLGINLIAEATSLLVNVGFKNAFDQIGHLNGIAVLVIAFTTFWIFLEYLVKNLNEGIYKNFKWISLATMLSMIVIYFIRG